MMQQRHSTVALVAALMIGSTLAGAPAFAAGTTNDAAKPGTRQTMTDKRLMVSNDGFKAERELGAARIAIFQGDTDAAKALVKDARGDLEAVTEQAPKDFPNGAPTADGKGAGDPDLIPIDGQMAVADDMVLTPDKASKVKEADQHLEGGDAAKAVDTLKQGAIAVAFTRVLMPIKETGVHADAAATLLDQGKYYEANLALKAAQDLLRTDTVTFGDTPAQAAQVTGLPATGSAQASGQTSGQAAAPAGTTAPAKK